jgi:hypothetical protein
MRNGKYTLVIAPSDYPGLRYRGRYIYEHHLVWWHHTGQIVPPGFLLHHKDDDKRRNVFDNLELKERGQHTSDHMAAREFPIRHGTLSGYGRRCRCDDCRAKHSEHNKAWRERRRQRLAGSSKDEQSVVTR